MIDKKISDIDYDYHLPESFKFANIMNIYMASTYLNNDLINI